MKKAVRTLVTMGLVVCVLLVNLGAKPSTNSFGLSKGNKTCQVSADVWNGMFFLNTAGTGHITRVELLIDDKTPTGVVRMAVYSATPSLLMEDLGYATVVDGWVSIEGLSIPVQSGHYYFLAFDLQSPNGVRAQKQQAPDSRYSAAYAYDANLTRSDSAVDMPPGGAWTDSQFVMRATVVSD